MGKKRVIRTCQRTTHDHRNLSFFSLIKFLSSPPSFLPLPPPPLSLSIFSILSFIAISAIGISDYMVEKCFTYTEKRVVNGTVVNKHRKVKKLVR